MCSMSVSLTNPDVFFTTPCFLHSYISWHKLQHMVPYGSDYLSDVMFTTGCVFECVHIVLYVYTVYVISHMILFNLIWKCVDAINIHLPVFTAVCLWVLKFECVGFHVFCLCVQTPSGREIWPINQTVSVLSIASCSLVSQDAWPGVIFTIVIKVWKEVWAWEIRFKSHPGLESGSSGSQVSSHLR